MNVDHVNAGAPKNANVFAERRKSVDLLAQSLKKKLVLGLENSKHFINFVFKIQI